CHESPTLAFICMVSITNNEEFMIAGVSAHITLHDRDGQVLDNQIVYAPLNQIPTGQEIPLIAIFDRKPSGYSDFHVDLLSAVQVADLIDELPEIDVVDTQTIYKAGKTLAEVSGTLSIVAHEGDELLVRVVGVVFDAKGEPIGMNVWEGQVESAINEEIEYRISIFSLGPEIAEISIYSEVMLK
ncbi:MAG: hypothetical protein KAI06_05860, partial [Anaerolineales bacterium]|nr:hypothetical protein [Anaerolineales bacterium]